MAYPTDKLSATPADHGVVLDDIRAMEDRIGYGPGKAVTESFIAGLWNSPEGVTANSGPAQDTLCLRRYEFPIGTTVTQLGMWVITAGTATAVVRLGVYADNGTGTYPGTLIVDGGVTTADISTTGFKSCTAFSAVDIGGIVWAGGVVQVAAIGAGQFHALSAGSRGIAIATIPNGNVTQSYTNTGVSGALPGTFGSTRAVLNGGYKVFFKG